MYKPSKSSLLQSRQIQQIRGLVRTQQALHHHLVQLQQRVAGLAPRKLLDRLYSEAAIDGQEYLTIMLATGLSEATAQTALAAAHADGGQDGWPNPATDVIEPNLPQYSGPKRAARRPPQRDVGLNGHPLD